MSVITVPMYRVVCDWLGCEASPQDNAEFWALSDASAAVDEAYEADWWIGRDGAHHYCNDHPSTWASDHEDGEPFPDEPYLLIHDGDLDDNADDGKVTLIGGAA